VNWDQLKQDLDATVRAQSVQLFDEAIAYLQEMRAKFLAGSAGPTPPLRVSRSFRLCRLR
jgi:hypothetical protein